MECKFGTPEVDVSDILHWMQLTPALLRNLATMICGNDEPKIGKHFLYRSSSKLTAFFTDCGLPHSHDGSTRDKWVTSVLEELNNDPSSLPDLPSDSLVRVICQLMDADYFEREETNRDNALQDLNSVLSRQGLMAFLDKGGKCHLSHNGTGISSTSLPKLPRALTPAEVAQRQRLSDFLDTASEDQFIEVVLVPFFQRLGFHRVNAPGHKEKLLEFGKDLWMKFQLPTGHMLYFGAQVKRVKIDSKGVSEGNVAEILNQVHMAMDHPIVDHDINRKVLIDHMFIISASSITRAAREWLGQKLDIDQRRRVIFMDRDELLSHAARIVSELPLPNEDDRMPF